EELSEQGQDIGRLVTDLIEHLRHLLLVQHTGSVPESLPVTEETREQLHAQANQLGEATVLRLCDLLAVAVDDMRQGGDPRLPLELALVKVTRPGADLSSESLAYRIGLLEQRVQPGQVSRPDPGSPSASEETEAAPVAEPPPLALTQLQEQWHRSVVPAVQQRSIPAGSLYAEARPTSLDGETLLLEFPADALFHRNQAEEPKNATVLREALYEVTGRRLALEFTLGENGREHEPAEEPPSEHDLIALMKEEFDAREVTE